MEQEHAPKYPVQTLEKALEILCLLSGKSKNTKEGGGFGISEISASLNMGKSTVHRILNTLMEYQYVERCENSTRYRLGMGVFKVGNAALAQHTISLADFTPLDELCTAYNEAVNVGVRTKNKVTIIYKCEAEMTLQVKRQIGETEPLHTTAMGKVLICELPEQQVRELFAATEMRLYTAKTISSVESLLPVLQRVRQQGYAMDEEEYCLGLTCLACPVRDYSGKIVAAMSVSGPSVRMTFNRVAALKEDLQKVSMKISKQLGYNR